jgi:thiosulfate reductase cytochrome b subunit
VATYATTIRRGLPRVKGGEPWPSASAAVPAHVAEAVAAPAAGSGDLANAGRSAPIPPVQASSPDLAPASATAVAAESAAASPAPAAAPAAPVAAAVAAAPVTLRRGLPRVPCGEPWPPAGLAPASAAPASAAPSVAAPESAPAAPAAAVAVPSGPRAPLLFTQTVFAGAAAQEWNAERRGKVREEPEEPRRYGPFTSGQWIGASIVAVIALLGAGAMLVFLVRWFISVPFMLDFLTTYPGEYHLPVGAPVGFPVWLGWQHFFNVFLIVLIIRSGNQVRSQKRPPAFWSPLWNKARKISINLWFHQSLDILWLVNGVIFIVLLFVTGQWMRIVPTSWEVFPNAVSAALQYVSLDWPTEDGWVNYNSLQQIAYFTTVFIAAPLAAITGVRMSGIWPKHATRLNKAYPIEWARAVHFPVMIYFVLFIIVHVTLVFATGALRNLNHMYGNSDEVNYIGFTIFAVSMIVIIAAWVAARPIALAPIARLFGIVSNR